MTDDTAARDAAQLDALAQGKPMPPFVGRLGLRAIKRDSRTLRLGAYLGAELPPPPPEKDWTGGVTAFGMMLNDQLGDCTIAALGHAVQTWSLASGGTEVTVPDSTIESAYSSWDGYVSGNASTDNGGIELDVLNDFRRDGLAGVSLLGYADPDPRNLLEIRQAIALLGGVYIGITLTNAQLAQSVWDVVPGDDSGIAGGHAVWVPKYEAGAYPFTCVTWGRLQPMTAAFWNSAVQEAHGLLSSDWLTTQGSPAGFDLATLQADLALLH